MQMFITIFFNSEKKILVSEAFLKIIKSCFS